jgi:putative ABC transport system permease protein
LPTLRPRKWLNSGSGRVAWLQLINSRGRFAAAIAGIAFTVVFSMLQLAFQDALYTSVTLFYSHLNAGLVLIGPRYQCIVATSNFPERRLYQALGDSDVESVSALYTSLAQWKNPVNGQHREIFVIGFQPREGIFDYPTVNSNLRQISEPEQVMFDEGSRPEFGPVPKIFRAQGPVTTELSHRNVRVIGLFRVGANFANDGNVLTSDVNFFHLVPYRKPGSADIGIIKLKPGVDAESARARMASALPGDVTVLTKRGLLEREKAFFDASLPVGFFFQMSVVIGLIVGAVIVYQILYNDVSERLPEYATLKAIGYSDRYLYAVVLQQALILSLVGFLPGLLLSTGVYEIARSATLLPVRMTALRILAVYLLTLVMCTVSGLLAMRNLRSADPADVF